MDAPWLPKLIGMGVLYLFLPITTLTYYFFRQQQKTFETERVLTILHIDPSYRKMYGNEKPGYYFLWAVAYTSVVSFLGLALLFFGTEIYPSSKPPGEFPSVPFGEAQSPPSKSSGEPSSVPFGGAQFPQIGSRLVCGMAFLGGYVWGLQYMFRRYALNDLTPAVYHGFSIRMILAALIALVLYNAYEALAGGDSGGDVTSKIWPVLAFMIGMFPKRGLRWLTDRLPILSSGPNVSVREAPLEMIEGIEGHDKMRLEELGIDSCYDLAVTDFVPLLLNTPYSARQLIDWILQAKLCVYFGAGVKELRQHSIRTVIDLKHLPPKDIEVLATEIALTKSALERARRSIQDNAELERLLQVGRLLGMFTPITDDQLLSST